MNRDSTIIQVALFLIVIAILGVAILKQQEKKRDAQDSTNQIVPIQVGETPQDTGATITTTGSTTTVSTGEVIGSTGGRLVERLSSPSASLVKQYFAYIANQEYDSACDLIAGTKCNDTNPIGLEVFSQEFQKMTNGYEYVAVKDYDIIAPSGKNVVCVKYSYRYKDDTNPGLISEILSFYTQYVGSTLMITDRVCEKKYKAGRGVRECPVQASISFCEGKIK